MPTTNSWDFPPKTREIQLDEKWAFVGKKQHNCDPDDELPAYKNANEATFSEAMPDSPQRKPGRPRILPRRRLPEGLNYATVHKHRDGDRVT